MISVLMSVYFKKPDSVRVILLAEIKDFGFEVRSSDNKGGGVAIIYKAHVDIRIIQSKHMSISSITTKDKLFRIVNVYRPDYYEKH